MSAPRRGDAMDAMDRAGSAVLVRVPHDGLALIVRALRAFDGTAREELACAAMADALERDLPPSMRGGR